MGKRWRGLGGDRRGVWEWVGRVVERDEGLEGWVAGGDLEESKGGKLRFGRFWSGVGGIVGENEDSVMAMAVGMGL